MIRRIVRMHFPETYVPEFIRLFNERKGHILNFPGCVSLELYQDADTPGVWYTWSSWQSVEDLEHYRQSPFFRDTWKSIKPQFLVPPQAFTLRSENE